MEIWKMLAWLAAAITFMLATPFAFEFALRRPATGLLAHTSLPLRLACYALLALIAVGSVLYDWNELGRTLALQRGTAATAAAWLLIFPLGMVLEHFIFSAWFIGILAISCYAAGSIFISLGRGHAGAAAGCAVAMTGFVAALNGHRLNELEHIIAVPVLFFMCRVFFRYLVQVNEEKSEAIADWPGLTLVHPDSEEFNEKLQAFEVACAKFAHKYPWHLHLDRLYSVDEGPQFERASSSRSAPLARSSANGRVLFHGTPRERAQGIVLDGFRLPAKAGMFGKGIYFADCPLKSWQYTDGQMMFRNGLILMCWVELGGRPSHQKKARNELTRPPRRSFTQWIKRESKYTSVIGDDHDAGGALRVPEYIIYDPKNVEVDYVCEVKCVPPGTPQLSAPPP